MAFAAKFEPVKVSARSAEPAVALGGETDVIAGVKIWGGGICSFELFPPQLARPENRNKRAIAPRNLMTSALSASNREHFMVPPLDTVVVQVASAAISCFSNLQLQALRPVHRFLGSESKASIVSKKNMPIDVTSIVDPAQTADNRALLPDNVEPQLTQVPTPRLAPERASGTARTHARMSLRINLRR